MKARNLHRWKVSVRKAAEIQAKLAPQVARSGKVLAPRLIAGADVSVVRGTGIAMGVVVVLRYPELKLVETQIVAGTPGFPYIPGFLSFRETPLVLAAFEKLVTSPDLILVDGQGIAHPRRMGLASHLGLFLDTPTIGCAKSRLCGVHEMPGIEAGSYAELRDDGEVIGTALRTKRGVRPVYVSIGHRVDLETAIEWVLKCCRGYRLPEPSRLAHLAAAGSLRQGKEDSFY